MTVDSHADDLFLRLSEGDELTDADRSHAEACAGCQQAIARAERFSSDVERWAQSVAVEPMPPDLVPEAAPSRMQLLRVVTFGAVVAAAVAIVLVLPPVLRPSGDPVSSAGASPLAVGTPIPSGELSFPVAWPEASGCAAAKTVDDVAGAAPDPLPAGTQIMWQLEEIPASQAGWVTSPLAVTSWGDRLVVVGNESEREGGGVRSIAYLREADGAWIRGDIAGDSLDLSSVAAAGDEVLALGTDYGGARVDPDVAIFRSRDGRSWQQIYSAPGYALSLHRVPNGWLALATDTEGAGRWVLTSTDGVDWQATELNPGIGDIAYGTDKWVAVGSVIDDDRTHAALWRSADGAAWSCEILAVAEPDHLARVLLAVDGPSGLVAFGEDNPRCRDGFSLCATGPNLLWQALGDGRWFATAGDAARPPTGNWAIAGDATSGLWIVGVHGTWHWDGQAWRGLRLSQTSAAPELAGFLPAGVSVGPGQVLAVGQTTRADGNPDTGVVAIGTLLSP